MLNYQVSFETMIHSMKLAVVIVVVAAAAVADAAAGVVVIVVVVVMVIDADVVPVLLCSASIVMTWAFLAAEGSEIPETFAHYLSNGVSTWKSAN